MHALPGKGARRSTGVLSTENVPIQQPRNTAIHDRILGQITRNLLVGRNVTWINRERKTRANLCFNRMLLLHADRHRASGNMPPRTTPTSRNATKTRSTHTTAGKRRGRSHRRGSGYSKKRLYQNKSARYTNTAHSTHTV